jgi:hypothetical protein
VGGAQVTKRKTAFLLVIAYLYLCVGPGICCSPDKEEVGERMKPWNHFVFDNGNLEFERVIRRSNKEPMLSRDQITYEGTLPQDGAFSPSQAFRHLEASSKGKRQETSESGARMLAGRLSGEVYSIDSLEFGNVKYSSGTVIYDIKFLKRESVDLTPAPAIIYFMIRLGELPIPLKKVMIHFDQWRVGPYNEDEEVPLLPSVLHDVNVDLDPSSLN